MPRRTKAPARQQATAPEQTLYPFAVDFFSLFGAEFTQVGRPDASLLDVRLPPELAAHFDRERLLLTFQRVEPQSGQELVAHGSRIFERMLAYLERRSAFTLRRLPRRVAGGEALMSALRPLNASVRDLRLVEQTQWLFFFTWRLTYRADDKRQELYTVGLNQQGGRLALAEESGTRPDTVDLTALLADAEAVELEKNAEGELLPPRLLPLGQLVKLAEHARKYAIYHADLRCVSHEAEILPRLHKTLNRLTTYYQQQIEEVYDAHDPDGEKRRILETDLERKIAEEVENHRLRIQVELISYIALEAPAAVLELVLTDGRRSAPLQVVQDRYSGHLQRPACHACGAGLTAVAIDRSGHPICDNCIQQCSNCQEIVCTQCGVEACPVCGRETCESCGRACWACGARACPDHISRCPTCGDEVCHACQAACAACGTQQCRSHLHADAVPGPGGATALICSNCAVRCPGCQQFTAQTGVCTASGQRFCRNCLVDCASCGRTVGPGFYLVSPVDKKPYCQNCQQECEKCGRITPKAVTCHLCGSAGCPLCMPRCSVCRHFVCASHSRRMENCGHVVCQEHSLRCAIGGEEVCPACGEPCAICERPHCVTHTRTCAQCHQEYCTECVRVSGLCDTCATVVKHGEPVDLAAQPWAGEEAVARLAPYYRWSRLSNTRYTVYFGDGTMMNGAVVVISHATGVDRVVHTRRIGAVERMRGLLGF